MILSHFWKELKLLLYCSQKLHYEDTGYSLDYFRIWRSLIKNQFHLNLMLTNNLYPELNIVESLLFQLFVDLLLLGIIPIYSLWCYIYISVKTTFN